MACCTDDICWPNTEAKDTQTQKNAGHKECIGKSNNVRHSVTNLMGVAYAMDLLHLLNQEASCIDSMQ